MARTRKVGRPAKKSSGGASVQEYREKRKRLASRLDYAGEKSDVDLKDVAMPEVPKVITPGSIRKLDRLMNKLKTALESSKLVQFYKEKRRQKERRASKTDDQNKKRKVKKENQETPDLYDAVIEQYEQFIQLAENYTYAAICFEGNSPAGTFTPGMYSDIQDHVSNCLDMLERIGAHDDDHKKQIAINLMNQVSEVYLKTEEYLYYYNCYNDEAYGASVLQAVEDILTQQLTGHGLTEVVKKSYAEILSRYGYDPDSETFEV